MPRKLDDACNGQMNIIPLVLCAEVSMEVTGGHLGPRTRTATIETLITPIPILALYSFEFQPGLDRPQKKAANPAPLGLCAFGLTVFLLGRIEMGVRDITQPSILVASAFAYAGLVQLLAGMWEMAVGNSFGATVLSSYGGFWISVGIIFTPRGFNIMGSLREASDDTDRMFYD